MSSQDVPLLSVIIPTTGGKKITASLPAVFKSHKNSGKFIEILVIRDGKWKNTEKESLKKFAKISSSCQLKLLENPFEKGAGPTRNIGIENSRGKILAFIGDDTAPDKNWISRIINFHQQNTKKHLVLLGKTRWEKILATDPWHQWIEKNTQFQYPKYKRKNLDWRLFYTTNISLKKEFLGKEKFSRNFRGWGFEDTELGYRLYKKGMNIVFDPQTQVFHDHFFTLKNIISRTKISRKNAEIFESLHPEVRILPRGIKKNILILILKMLSFYWGKNTGGENFAKKSLWKQKIYWWYCWKNSWIGK